MHLEVRAKDGAIFVYPETLRYQVSEEGELDVLTNDGEVVLATFSRYTNWVASRLKDEDEEWPAGLYNKGEDESDEADDEDDDGLDFNIPDHIKEKFIIGASGQEGLGE